MAGAIDSRSFAGGFGYADIIISRVINYYILYNNRSIIIYYMIIDHSTVPTSTFCPMHLYVGHNLSNRLACIAPSSVAMHGYRAIDSEILLVSS